MGGLDPEWVLCRSLWSTTVLTGCAAIVDQSVLHRIFVKVEANRHGVFW
jgi:hypothetical protein